MTGRKVWCVTGVVRRERRQDNFALFRRILRSHPLSRPSRETRQIRAHIVWKSPQVEIEQSAFVVHRESIPTDH